MIIDKIKNLIYKTLKHKATQNFIIIALISLLQILSNVLLGRVLSKEDFGRYSFIIYNIIRVFSVLFLFGQTSSILRLFSSNDIQEFKWKKKLGLFLLLILIPIIMASFGVVVFYELSPLMIGVVALGSMLVCCTMILASIYRSQRKYNSAVIIERFHAIIFMPLLLYPFFILKQFDFVTASILKLVSYSAIVPIIIYIFIKWKEGPRQITRDTLLEGLSLWELSLSVIVLGNIDSFFIVKILDYKELALYSIIGSILIVFDFSREAIFSVYSQKFAETKKPDSQKLVKLVILIIIALSLFYVISTNFILQILFDGKYSSSILLLILFCINYSLGLIYVIPSCYFVGQGIRLELRKMLAVNIVSIVLRISLIFLFSKHGLIGFLLAGIISQGFRTAGGYYIAFRR